MKGKNLKTKISIISTAIVAVIIAFCAVFGIKNVTSKKTANIADPANLKAIEYAQVSNSDVYAVNTQTGENCENVKFSAFFAKDVDGDGNAERLLGSYTSGDTLYMDLGVDQGGTLKNGKITINAQNYKLSMNMLRDTVLSTNYVSDDVDTIYLNTNIDSGTQELIMGNINWNVNSKDDFSANSTITLTGTYVSETGDEIEIKKQCNLTTDYIVGKSSVTVKSEAPVMWDYNLVEENPVNVGFSLEYTTAIFNKENNIKVTIPEKDGYSATDVSVTGLSEEGSYNFENGILTIKDIRESSEKRKYTYGINVCYPAELYNELKSSINTFGATNFIFDVEAYSTYYNNPRAYLGSEYQTDVYNTSANVRLQKQYSNSNGQSHEVDVNFVMDGSDFVDKTTQGYREDTYASRKRLLSAYDNKQKYEYAERWSVHRKNPTINSTTIAIRDTGDSIDSVSLDNYSAVTKVIINNSLIPNTGKIRIYDDETNDLIQEFSANSSMEYILHNPVKKVRIETTRDNNEREGELIVKLVKELDFEKFSADYDRYEIENFSHLSGYASFSGDEIGELTDYEWLFYKKVTSCADLSINEASLAADIVNPVTRTIRIYIPKPGMWDNTYVNDYSREYSEWKNGKFLVVVPKSVVSYLKLTDNETNELYEDDNNFYIEKQLTSETNYSRILDIPCEMLPNISNMASRASIDLYYYNEECTNYENNSTDIYDINKNGKTDDIAGISSCDIQTTVPTTFFSYETVSDYGEDEKVIKSPDIAKVSNSTRKATIGVNLINGYKNEIVDVTLVGRVPTKDNTYVEGVALGSNYTTKMTSDGIKIPENIAQYARVYYSESNTCNNDLTESENGWIEASEIESFDNIKSYMVVFDRNVIKRNTMYTLSYDITIPEDLDSADISYACHKLYFSLDTNNGLLQDSVQPQKLGIMIAKYYDLDITKHEKDSDKAIQSAKFLLNNSYSFYNGGESGTDGSVHYHNLIANLEYNLYEKYAPNMYEINSEKAKFKVVEQEDGSFKYEQISGELFDAGTAIVEDENNRYKLTASISDMPKYKINVTKIDKETRQPIQGVTYTLGNDRFNTNQEGKFESSYLSYAQEYTLTEIKADGYFIEDPITFTINKNGDNYTFDTTNECISNATVTQEESTGITVFNVTVTNEKIPTFDLEIIKESEEDETQKLKDAKFNLRISNMEAAGTYTTDENGIINVNGLYRFNERRGVNSEFRVVEVVAPDGYINNREAIKFSTSQDDDGKLIVNVENAETLTTLKSAEVQGNKLILTIHDKPFLELKKVDAETNQPLAGVSFVIFEVNDNFQTVDYARDINGEYIGNLDEKGNYTVTTNENGIIPIPIRPGKYKIIETDFLEGYEDKTKVEYFTISDNYEIKMGYIDEVIDPEWATVDINYIEDLVDLSNASRDGERYHHTTFKLARTLSFNEDASYRNPDSYEYGDINGNGTVEKLKEELTNQDAAGFVPIETIYGNFDGNGFEIKDLYINRSGTVALFKNVYNVYDLGVTGTVRGKGELAGIAARANSIRNCYSDVDIYGDGLDKSIDELPSYSDTYGGGLHIGGVAWKVGASIVNSYNTGNIDVTFDENVIGKIENGVNYLGDLEIAGVVGAGGNSISKCHNTGNINVSIPEGSRFVYEYIYGISKSIVVNSYNTGEMNINANAGTAYIYGITSDSATNCYNRGNIRVNGSLKTIFGITKATSTNCYSTANINVTGTVGGIYKLGRTSTNSYYLDTASFTPSNKVQNVGSFATEEYMKSDSFVTDLNRYAWAKDTETVNDGYPILKETTSTSTSSESSSSIVQISCVEDLIDVVNAIKGGNIYSGKTLMLTDNIDFNNPDSYKDAEKIVEVDINGNGTCEPIKTELTTGTGFPLTDHSAPFGGTFDGNGYEIQNLYINTTSNVYVALFGMGYGATIKNLGITGNITAENADNVASFIAKNSSGSSISDCYNKANITVKNVKNIYGIGDVNNIDRCYNKGNITVTGDNNNNINAYGIGGGYLNNSYNRGNITVSGIKGVNIYGTGASPNITNTYNTGNTVGTSTSGSVYVEPITLGGNPSVTVNCYYLESAQIEGNRTSRPGTAKSSADMKTQEFVDLLGNSVWELDSNNSNDGYPILKPALKTDIEYIEDLVAIANYINAGNSLAGKKITLKKDLDFANIECYKDVDDTSFGDINGNGNSTEGIKAELTSGKGFAPIAMYSYPFEGIFDGGNHTISNLYINRDSNDNSGVGLFGCVAGAEIKDLTVSGNIQGNSYVGLCGLVLGGTTIENCKYMGIIRSSNDGFEIGGIVGQIGKYSYSIVGKVVIKSCESYGEINSNGYYIGGIVGQITGTNGNVEINNCHNHATITGQNQVAGILGSSDIMVSIKDCSNEAAINGSGNNVGGIIGCGHIVTYIDNCSNSSEIKCSKDNVGGIAGYLGAGSYINNCINSGKITSDYNSAIMGGIVGSIGNSREIGISNCKNTAEINKNNDNSASSYIGGIVGKSEARIYNCENSGDVFVNKAYKVGGIVGEQDYKTVEHCTNIGAINVIPSNTSYVGGISGEGGTISYCKNQSAITITNSTNTSSDIYVGGVVGRNPSDNQIKYSGNIGEISLQGNINDCSVGGIAGTSGSLITYTYNLGPININSSVDGSCLVDVGGIVGNKFGEKTSYSYNKGIIDISTNSISYDYERIGGIAGTTTSVVTNCYNTSNIVVDNVITSSSSSTHDYIGGVVGYGDNVKYCYNTGSILNKNNSNYDISLDVGGVAGYADSVEVSYNTGNINNISIRNTINNAVGGVVGVCDEIKHVYNQGNIKNNVTLKDSNNSTYYDYVGGIVGKGSKSEYTYNVGNIENLDKTSEALVVTGPISGKKLSNGIANYYSDNVDVSGKVINYDDEFITVAESDEYMRSNDFYKTLHLKIDNWTELPEQYPILVFPVYVSGEEYTEVIVENNPLKYEITTEVAINDNGVRTGGTITGEYTNEYIEAAGIKYVETVKYNNNATKSIVITPDESYKIISLTVNGELYNFEPAADGSVTIPSSYFVNVKKDYHVVAKFGETNKVLTIYKYDEDTNSPIEGAVFGVYQYDDRDPISNEVKELINDAETEDYIDPNVSADSILGDAVNYETDDQTYGFTVSSGTYTSNNKNKNSSIAGMYIPIDLTNSEKDYYLSFNFLLRSQLDHDYGIVAITNSTTPITPDITEGIVKKDSGYRQNQVIKTPKLLKGNTYYLHVIYSKDESGYVSDDALKISNIQVHENINAKYGFDSVDGKYVSNNNSKLYVVTYATANIPIDLRGKTGKYTLKVNCEKTGTGSNGYLVVNNSDSQLTSGTGGIYDSGIYNRSATNVETVLEGGQMYYLHLIHQNNATASASTAVNKFTINSIQLELNTSDFITKEPLVTDANGKIQIELNNGSYKVKELKAAEGYELDSTEYTCKIGNGTINQVDVPNKRLCEVVIHYYENETGPEYATEPIEIESDKYTYGSLNESYRAVPFLRSGQYRLAKDENGYIVPDNAVGVFAVDPTDVYFYYEAPTAEYRVHYFYDGVEDDNELVTASADVGSKIETYEDKVHDGYIFTRVEGLPLEIQEDDINNDIYVYYERNTYPYKIEYYYDGVLDDSKTVNGTHVFNETISTYEDKVIDGYKLDRVENCPLTITSDENSNIMKVYYVKDSFAYTVHYFYDGTEDEGKKIESTAEFESTIEETDVPDKNITGYKKDRIEGTPLTISLNPEDNVINVYYVKDSFAYTVHYFYDGTEDEGKKIESTAEFGSTIEEKDVPDKNITGYKKQKVEGVPLTIGATASENVINVYYVKDSFAYTVHYFYDGTEDDSKGIESTAEFGSTIEEKDVPDKNITGYKKQKVEGVPLTISATASENVINVYYVKDNFAYTVRYFYEGDDGTPVEDTSKEENLSAEFGSTIEEVPEKNKTGYRKDRTETLPFTITDNVEDNVINVYYVKNNYGYTVHYFYNNIEDITKKITDEAKYGTVIRTVPEKNITGYRKDRTETLPMTISQNEDANVVNVYYEKDNFDYSVHYFYENDEGVQVEDASKAYTQSAVFGSTVSTYTPKVIDGYVEDKVRALDSNGNEKELPLEIKADVDKNVINVYYVRNNYNYTVHYFYENNNGTMEEDASKKETLTAKFGSKIGTYTPKVITGYALNRAVTIDAEENEKELPLEITSNPNKNIINVYYSRLSYEYTVRYFYEGDEGTPVEDTSKKETLSAKFGSSIIEVPEKNIDGYKHNKTKKMNSAGEESDLPLIISSNPADNIINVYYIKKDLGYEVHYFYEALDGEMKEDPSKVERYNSTIGEQISTFVNKEDDGFTFNKAVAINEIGNEDILPLVIKADEDRNIIKVYYNRNSYNYTVNYFYNGTKDDSKTETLSALYESEISTYPDKSQGEYELDKAKTISADGLERDLPLVIGTEASKNVINVYYKAEADITVRYVDNLTGEEIIPNEIITGKIGKTYTVERKNIPGYKMDLTQIPINETGTVTSGGTTVTYTYIELRPYELQVRYSSGEEEHDEVKVAVSFGGTYINDYTTNGILKIADIELTDLVTENYTIYETEIPEYCNTVVSEENPAVVELIRRLNTEQNKYEFVANYENIEGFKVVIDEENHKVIFDITATKDERYDLALQKFVSSINGVLTKDRAPKVKVSEDGKISYEGNDEIEKTENNQNVTYTIRMYNESEVRARGKRVIEYIPDGLVFVPDDEINIKYGWRMYKSDNKGNLSETHNSEEAVIVVTDYLDGKHIEKFDRETNKVSYLDVEVLFRVDESKLTSEDRIIENKVQIMTNKNDGNQENDITTEKLYVKYFDLDIEKYIEKVIVENDDGIKEETYGYSRKGELVKLDVRKSQVNKTKITVTYGIVVKNIGEIPGKATEVVDYAPEGFKLVQDSIWNMNGDVAITESLADKVIEPGESTVLNITFEWKLSESTIGLKSNEAHIATYTNEFNAKDLTEDNRGRQDMLVTVKTGSEVIMYVAIGMMSFAIIVTGVTLIKRKIEQ